jgi:hypothetical protein
MRGESHFIHDAPEYWSERWMDLYIAANDQINGHTFVLTFRHFCLILCL